MRKIALIGAIATTLFAASAASARDHWVRVPHSKPHKTQRATASVCPFDGPDTTFTIVNAGVTGVTLQQWAAVEQATRDESFALRLYYGSPCARFGPGGIPIYMSNGYQALPGGGSTYQMSGIHYPTTFAPTAAPAIYVSTGLLPYTTWVRAFSHEILEYLVNPSGTRLFGTYLAEVCDPVENLTYEVDQLQVSDFVTPNYWSRGAKPWDAAHRL